MKKVGLDPDTGAQDAGEGRVDQQQVRRMLWRAADGALRLQFGTNLVEGTVSQDSADAAVIVVLNPGAYSVVAAGVNNATGVALTEVYEVP